MYGKGKEQVIHFEGCMVLISMLLLHRSIVLILIKCRVRHEKLNRGTSSMSAVSKNVSQAPDKCRTNTVTVLALLIVQ